MRSPAPRRGVIHRQWRVHERERLAEVKAQVDALARGYFDEIGAHAYARLNIISDIGSNPLPLPVRSTVIDALQKRAGNWIEDFADAISDKDFNRDDYLGKQKYLLN